MEWLKATQKRLKTTKKIWGRATRPKKGSSLL